MHPSGLVAFANDTAIQATGRTPLVGTSIESVLAPLETLRSVERAQTNVGYTVADIAPSEDGSLCAVVVHDMPRALQRIGACDGTCDGSNTAGICTLCWEQNLLKVVGHSGPNPKEEALAFCNSAVGQADVATDAEAAPIPPPPTWHDEQRDFDQLVSDGAEALLTKEYRAALEAYEMAARLRPDAPRIQMIRGNLERLRELVAASD
ncbi:MAG: hypothetical protein ACRBN8_08875 [Nannocystales bacterium]